MKKIIIALLLLASTVSFAQNQMNSHVPRVVEHFIKNNWLDPQIVSILKSADDGDRMEFINTIKAAVLNPYYEKSFAWRHIHNNCYPSALQVKINDLSGAIIFKPATHKICLINKQEKTQKRFSWFILSIVLTIAITCIGGVIQIYRRKSTLKMAIITFFLIGLGGTISPEFRHVDFFESILDVVLLAISSALICMASLIVVFIALLPFRWLLKKYNIKQSALAHILGFSFILMSLLSLPERPGMMIEPFIFIGIGCMLATLMKVTKTHKEFNRKLAAKAKQDEEEADLENNLPEEEN